MQVYNISSQSFGTAKFRLPITRIRTKWGNKPTDCYKEFDNPNAGELYNSAQQTSNLKKRISFFHQMGEYRIVNNSSEGALNNFLKRELP